MDTTLQVIRRGIWWKMVGTPAGWTVIISALDFTEHEAILIADEFASKVESLELVDTNKPDDCLRVKPFFRGELCKNLPRLFVVVSWFAEKSLSLTLPVVDGQPLRTGHIIEIHLPKVEL